MLFPFTRILKSETDTIKTAGQFASIVKPGDLITLTGDLGSGKTFFVKSVCNKYGVNSACSPTFAIVNEYYGSFKIYHFDFYRINKEEELYDIGFVEYLNDKEAVKFVEWAELYPSLVRGNGYSIKITILENDYRNISIQKI